MVEFEYWSRKRKLEQKQKENDRGLPVPRASAYSQEACKLHEARISGLRDIPNMAIKVLNDIEIVLHQGQSRFRERGVANS